MVRISNTYKDIIDNIPVAILLAGKDLIIESVNEKACKLFQYAEQELTHAHISTIFPDDQNSCSFLFNNNIELTGIKKNGESFMMNCSSKEIVVDEEVFYCISIEDITAEKKAEALNSILINNTREPFMLLDTTLTVTCFNDRFYYICKELLHMDIKIGARIMDFVPDGNKAPVLARYKKVLEGHTEKSENYVPYEGGVAKHFENIYSPVKNEKNEVTGIFITSSDVTDTDLAKLMESVITNTRDIILITEAEPQQEPGPRILFVNEAFTKLTGYTSEEVIGETPRILQGPKTDQAVLKKLSDSMRKWEASEATVINYKKNGEEFWANFSVSPVANTDGYYTHWISIEKDVTVSKQEELENTLTVSISHLFTEPVNLQQTLEKVLEQLCIFGDFDVAEVWLIGTDKNTIRRTATFYCEKETALLYEKNTDIRAFAKGEGLPGQTWATNKIQLWGADEDDDCERREAATNAGLKKAYGVPILYNNTFIGSFVLGLKSPGQVGISNIGWLERLSNFAGAEIKRKQLEEELNQVFNFAPDIICIPAADGYFKKTNPAMCRILEYSEAELLSIPFIHLMHPDDREDAHATVKKLSDGQSIFNYENRYITKSGKIKWLSWTAAPSPEEGLFFAVAKDITQKKELAELLNKANNLARIGGWEVDFVNGKVFWSRITKEIHEVTEDYEPSFETGIQFYKEETGREIIRQKTIESIENGNSWDVEAQIVTAKGNEKWIRVIGNTEFVNGICVRIYGSFQDIDTLKRNEIELQKTMIEKNTILESIDDAFFAVDKNWIVTYWNNKAEKILGKRKEEIIGEDLWSVFKESIGSVSYIKYSEALKTNHAINFEDYYEPLQKWYDVGAYPSVSGLSVYFKDITERKLTEIRLSELNAELEKHAKDLAISNAELEQFAYVASHDLQEPLRMITSFVSQLDKKYGDLLDDRGKKYIEFAVDGAKRMRQIILDLLEFSRIGRLNDAMENVDTAELISEIGLLYRKHTEEKNAVITMDEMPLIKTYKTPLRQVFQNLLSNSLKYTKPGIDTKIHIGFSDQDTHWQFVFEDNGIGIDEAYFEKIFIIFQRLHNKDEYSGTGMGLAVTKKIIENLGGKIWVESVEGEGAAFYFTLAKV